MLVNLSLMHRKGEGEVLLRQVVVVTAEEGGVVIVAAASVVRFSCPRFQLHEQREGHPEGASGSGPSPVRQPHPGAADVPGDQRQRPLHRWPFLRRCVLTPPNLSSPDLLAPPSLSYSSFIFTFIIVIIIIVDRVMR